MFSLLVFLFKLFFSTFFSVLFSYFIAEEEENNLGVVLFGILGVLISYLSMASSDMYSGVSIAILASFIVALSYYFFDVSNNNEKLLFIFPGLIGLMIGFSLVVESIFIIGFLYIAKNSLNYIYDSDDDNTEKVENQENIK